MKTKFSFVCLLFAVISLLLCVTSCSGGEPSGPPYISPNERLKEFTYGLDTKTDLLIDIKNVDNGVLETPDEITFVVSVGTGNLSYLDRLYATITVCDANGNFLCVANTPTQGWTPGDKNPRDYTIEFTVKDLPNATMAELYCTPATDLQVTLEVINADIIQYDKYGEKSIERATEMPPKQKLLYTKDSKLIADFCGDEEFRLAAKILMNGGYEQALGIFEKIIQDAKDGYGNSYYSDAIRYTQPYADKCHEILGR